MEHITQLIAAIEAKSEATGYSTTTICRMCGLGGDGLQRLKDGKRMWPDTAAKAMAALEGIEKKRAGAA